MRSRSRVGYTLIELLVVLAVIILLGAVVSSTLTGNTGNSKVKAAADDATGLIATARAHATEEGRNYRLAVSQDGTKLRVSPDDPAAIEAQSGEDAVKPFVQEIQLPTDVTVVPTITGSEMSTSDAEGWVRLATFQQDGTCREDLVDFEIREPGVNPLVVQIRGLTGHTTVNPAGKK
jgi:type II secretory pathway pseudopilin PulG